MKRILSILTAAVLLLASLSLPAFASPKTELYDALREACPERYYTTYLAMFENVLAQIPVTQQQADKCIVLAKETRKVIATDRGPNLSNYTKEEQQVVLQNVKETFETLGLTVRIRAMGDTTVWELMKDGRVVGEITRAAIRNTGLPEAGQRSAAPAVLSGIGAGGVLVLFILLAVKVGRRNEDEKI